jgi:hypothetical protein
MLAGCSGAQTDDDDSEPPGPTPTPAALECTAEMQHCTYVREHVFQPSCGLSSSCHTGTGPAGEMDLIADPCGHAVIDVAPSNTTAAGNGLMRVRPGSLEQSFLWMKVNTEQQEMPEGYGDRMPPPNLLPDLLDPAQRDIIRCWILAGAPAD